MQQLIKQAGEATPELTEQVEAKEQELTDALNELKVIKRQETEAKLRVIELNDRLDAFRAAAEKMGAIAVPSGDAGFLFELVGGYQMQILAWAGDDEFPPNAQVLYSDNFADGFAAEDRVVAGDILISTIKANM